MKVKIIHFSDTHESMPMESRRGYFDKRLFGAMNSRLLRKRIHDQQLLDLAVRRILEEKPDVIVYTGDATSFGQPSEFAAARKRLEPILESSIPFLYTPGNHDSYVRDRICQEALRNFYCDLHRGKRQLSDHPAFLCEHAGLAFLSVHCARPTLPFSSCGHMPGAAVRFLESVVQERRLEKDRRRTAPLLLCGHFPILEQRPFRRMRHRLYGAAKAAAMLRAGEIDLSLCGHVHAPYEVLDSSGRGEICAGSLTRYATFALIEYDSEQNSFSLSRISLKK